MSVGWILRTVLVAAAMAVGVRGHAAAQEAGVYRALTVQAAPGDLLELIDLYREEQALLAGLGEEPPMWMRHSQGDIWDLLLLYPVADLSGYFDTARTRRLLGAMTPGARSGAELQREIDARTAWREEVFVRGPAVDDVKGEWTNAGYYHVEMFQGLAGRRAELVREREMENDYLVRLGRKPNHIFTRIAGSATDALTIGYYRDLKAYANPAETMPEEQDAAAVAAGFKGAAFIGTYLRELILRHHDTLAVPIR